MVETEGSPRLRYWLDRLSTDGIIAHVAVVYGYFPAVSQGDDVIVLTEPKPDAAVRFRFTLSEELQLHPEQSTDAFVLHHPEAKYFNT